MKKTIFTVCSVVAVCAAVFLACTKDDNGNKQVSYASQTTYGSGNNPNPNNNPSSSGYSTAGTTTSTTVTPTCTKALSYDGTACSAVLSSISANVITESGNCGTVTITFPGSGAPAAASYFVVSTTPLTAGQCTFDLGGTLASGGTLTITTGTFNKASFTGIVCGTHTMTGVACY